MSNLSIKCLSCGEKILIDDQREFGFCSFCGSKIINNNESASTSDQLEKLLKNAETLYQLGDIERAKEIFKNVTNDYPSDYRAWLKLEELFIYETAKPFYNAIEDIKEKGTEFLFSKLFTISHIGCVKNRSSIWGGTFPFTIKYENHQNFKSVLVLAPKNEVERIRNEYKQLENLRSQFLSLEKDSLKKSRISMSETIKIYYNIHKKWYPFYEKYHKIQYHNQTAFFRKKQVTIPSFEEIKDEFLENELICTTINKDTYNFYEKYIISNLTDISERADLNLPCYQENACRNSLAMIDMVIDEIDKFFMES